MFDKIIAYSIQNKFVIGLLVMALIAWGIYSLRQLPIDAVPDITNNQVQVITTSPTLATQEIEQFITTPIELSLQNIQQLVELRSISRFGLSVVTVVFEEDMDIYLARQLVNEHLKQAKEDIPEGLGSPDMAPVSTGLGEIYQYVVRPLEGYEEQYPPTELRSIQDWIIRRQLSGIDGVIEVNTLGGFLKQYEVAIRPATLKSMNISITDVFEALEKSNENTGGAYIERNPNTYYIRTNGMAKSLKDIENIVVEVRNGNPILIKDLAKVQFGKAPRYGAMTRDGEEVVGGIVMMLKGANSAAVIERIEERVEQVQKSLPEGVVIEPFLVRDKLVDTAISTVKTNLLEGGLIVVFILVLLLGNWRAGLIVASVIPLAMLFAVSMMNVFGISANLMSLGAIDFGLIVDGAVIIVEAIVHRLNTGFAGQRLSAAQMNLQVQTASQKIRNSAAFGEIIILMVYIPILALVGIEGKMFKPMAQTVMLAIGGALILSLTYVPMMSAFFLNKTISAKRTIADRIIDFCHRMYAPVLNLALRTKTLFVILTSLLFALSLYTLSRMGGEFIPTLEEGDLALHQILPPGSALSQSVDMSKIIQNRLLTDFPEIEDVVTKIGSSEIPTDPMPVETGDIIVIMKPKSEWTSANSRQEMFEKMEASLKSIPGVGYEFSQPIQMRFNELMTGSRADIAVKLFGEDLDLLYQKAKEAEAVIQGIEGVGSTKVEQVVGMPQIVIDYKYDKMAQYGLQVQEVNQTIRAAFAGEQAGVIYEGERRFDMVVRLDEADRQNLQDVEELFISLANGGQVPLLSVAEVNLVDAPMQISRENTNRRIVIGVNVGNRDVESLVEEIQENLDEKVVIPAGYYFSYGGQFENLEAAKARLGIAVPIALALIFVLLFFTFGDMAQAALVFTAIPLSAIGGIWALELRGMPFSISAGIGFIALFGVAVLNGIVLIGYFNQLRKEGMEDIAARIQEGTRVRLRPVLMTAAVASLGFLPMALSNSGGAEVQRPLATVVIGGLITATFLTLVILPILYSWLARWQEKKVQPGKALKVLLPFLLLSGGLFGQQAISVEEAVAMALENHPGVQAASKVYEQQQYLQDLPYSLGPTTINYQGDALFRENGQQVNQIAFAQSIPHPAGNKAQNDRQEQVVGKARLELQLSENQLRRMVRSRYLELQYSKSQEASYREMVTLYQDYYQIAIKRAELGTANKLEALHLQSALSKMELQLEQIRQQVITQELQLSTLLRSDQTLTSSDSLKVASVSNTDPGNSLAIQLAQQEAQIEESNVRLLESGLKPDFRLGYAVQNFSEDGWLSGIQAGVEIPLFRKAARNKIEAQQLLAAASILQIEAVESTYSRELLEAESKIAIYKAGVETFRKQWEEIAPELQRVSELNYEAGTIGYLELLFALDLVVNIKIQYQEQIKLHNEAVLNYQYLSNQ